jgi:threonine dehydrogenase-like Zn-dependent dehydrogenase
VPVQAVGGLSIHEAVRTSQYGAPIVVLGAPLMIDANSFKVAFVGESFSTTINPSDQLIRKQLQVIGAWYFPVGEFEQISRFVLDQQIPVEKMITHRFSLGQAAEAFSLFDERKTEKAIFVWD